MYNGGAYVLVDMFVDAVIVADTFYVQQEEICDSIRDFDFYPIIPRFGSLDMFDPHFIGRHPRRMRTVCTRTSVVGANV